MKKLIALGFVAALVAAFKLLPWWAGVGLLVGLGLGAKFLAGRLFERFAMGMFKAKSSALAGASATLHGIQLAQAPKVESYDDDEDWEDDEVEMAPRVYRYLDVTITPKGSEGLGTRISEDSDEDIEEIQNSCAGFTMWDPDELILVKPDAQEGLDEDSEEEIGSIVDVALYEDGNWIPYEGNKLFGSHRVRLHVAVDEGHDQFKLKYYFEILKNAA